MDDKFLYLYKPSTSIIEPPIEATARKLPIENLVWEDFERLCLRVAETIHSIDDCEIYGVKGQKQDGIDIFAIKNNDQYSSYQCKRYKIVTENVLEKAINSFLDGDWFAKSDQFIFCTTFSLNKTQLQKKFNGLKAKLKRRGKELKKWDNVQLNRILKQHPQIVYDFFGKEWVKKFNGELKLKHIEASILLDSNQVVNYRKELFHIYSTIFQQYDPSIPSSELNDFSILLQERFIVPDFFEKKHFDESSIYKESERDFYEEQLKHHSLDIASNNSLKSKKRRTNHQEVTLKIESRINIDSILPSHDRIMILGEPGSGKSTLLHYIILDLLSNKPQLENIAKKWGKLLPIWLPFAFITKNLNNDPNLSLSELLRMWFKSIDKAAVFEFVKYALEDKRLLLVVDGIDEWTNENVAKQAISRIEIQSQLTNAKVIYSSRPYGYRKQKESFSKIQEFNIAPFSETQQRKYISYWYKKWISHIKLNDPDYVNNETSDFLVEIKKSNDFIQLAGNPLLLGILISQRFKYSILPKNKIKALHSITEHLIDHHPNRRRTSANIIEENELDFELSEIFSVLAIHIQKECHDGVINKKDAQKVIEKYLREFIGYDVPRAKKFSKNLLNIGTNSIGIIIEKSSNEIAFMHRQFQEFMAAKYLFESNQNISEEFIKSYSFDTQWNQVITFFFGQIPNMKKSDFEHYLSLIEVDDARSLSYAHFLKFSLVLNQNNSPINTAKDYLQKIISQFELETNPAHKLILWDIILDSTFNAKLKSSVIKFLFQYFPNEYKFDDYRIRSVRNISADKLTVPIREFMLKSLINGNSHQKIDASYTIKKFISDEWLYNQIIQILDNCTNPEILPYAINTIVSDKIDFDTKKKYLDKFQNSEHSEVALFYMKLKVNLKLHQDRDLEPFLYSQRDPDYVVEDEVLQILIDGWPTSEFLLDTSLKSVGRHLSNRKIDSKLAWKILFHCFNKEDKVALRMVEELKNEEYPFISLDAHRGWPYISNYFRDNQILIPEIEKWIEKQKHREPEIAYASLIGRTENNKKYLLDNLPKSGIPHWYVMALVEGWPNDEEVHENLKNYFRSDAKNTFYAAQYIDTVFKNHKKEGIEILEKILFNREVYFRDRAVQPLIALDKKYFEDTILERFLKDELIHLPKGGFNQYFNALRPIIDTFPKLDIVKKYISNHSTSLSYIIEYYPDWTEKIDNILQSSRPLGLDFRIKIIDLFKNRNILNDTILNQLSLFPKEEEEVLRASAAVIYYNFLKTTSTETIIDNCKKYVFARGHDYVVQRQIAFCGYLISKKLSEYFQLKEEGTNDNARPRFSFDSSYREMSPVMIRLLIHNFEYLYSSIDGNFSKIEEYESNDAQNAWGFWAKYSDVHSPTFPYILEFIKNNNSTIQNRNLIDFLRRTAPQSTLLKNILLRILKQDNTNDALYCGQILGENFNSDIDVYQEVNTITHYFKDGGKILAMCYGWPNDIILKEIFEKVIRERHHIDSKVGYNLKFLFRDIDNIMMFFKEVFDNYNRAKFDHKNFIEPLYKRIVKDETLQEEIKSKLLNTSSNSEIISYHAILDSVNKIDEDITKWKETQLSESLINGYGYNIMTNMINSTSEILDKVYF
ncbi:MAG: NACHT domain-containing protein [Bacteroidota bacterium]